MSLTTAFMQGQHSAKFGPAFAITAFWTALQFSNSAEPGGEVKSPEDANQAQVKRRESGIPSDWKHNQHPIKTGTKEGISHGAYGVT